MKSISIHGVDKEMARRIREKSAEYGLSVNRTMKKLLGESLGLENEKAKPSHEFDDLCGILPKKAGAELEKILQEMDTVDPEAWS
jgi:hypothetical protein